MMVKTRPAFTLVEVFIALALSSVIAVGLYSILSTIASLRDTAVITNDNIINKEKLTVLFNKDSRMIVGNTYAIDSSTETKKLKFTTFNSLRFNKSIPVEVTYYIKDDYLIRREINTDLLYDMQMKIVPNVEKMTFRFFDGNEFKDEAIQSSKILEIELTIKGNTFKIITGSVNE